MQCLTWTYIANQVGHALADVGGDASLLSVMQATSAAGHAAAVAFSQARSTHVARAD